MIKIAKTRDVKTPVRGHPEDAGLDFFVPEDFNDFVSLEPGESILIKSGIKMMVPNGYAGIFFNKSGVGIKAVLVGAQVVDSTYRGEIHLNLHNVGNTVFNVYAGQKITQMLIIPILSDNCTLITEQEFDRNKTSRGSGGFGSTGK